MYVEIIATGVKGRVIAVAPETGSHPMIYTIEEEFGDHEHEWVEAHDIRIRV